MQRKVAGIAVGILAAAAVLIAVLLPSWWSGDPSAELFGDLGMGALDIHAGLRKLRVCALETCQTLPYPAKRGLFGLLSILTYYGSFIGVAVALGSVALYAVQGSAQLARATTAVGLSLAVLGTWTFFVFPGGGLDMSWGYPVFLLGVLLGMPITGYLHRVRDEYGGVAKLVDLGARPPVTTRAPEVASAPVSKERLKEDFDRVVKDAAGGGLASAFGAAPGKTKPSVAKVRAASTDAAAAVLRFVAREAQLTEGAISGQTGNTTTPLPFADIGEIVIGQLPPDLPFEKLLFLDLIPRAGGPPVRLLPSTRVNYAQLPGGAGTTSQENFRKLVTAIQTKNPAVTIDPLTLAFVKERKPPRQFAASDQFADYDARFSG